MPNGPRKKAIFRYGSPGTTGAVNELLVAIDLAGRGFELFRALSPSCSCDLIALKNGKAIRVEVTAGYMAKNGGLSAGKPRNPARYDVLAVIVGSQIAYQPDWPGDPVGAKEV